MQMMETKSKEESIHSYFNGFGWKAYEQLSVPDDAQFPYITYSVATDSLGNVCPANISLWDYSSSWRRVTDKANEIAQRVKSDGFDSIKFKDGYITIYGGTPFAQRLADTNNTVKRIYINLNIEFLSLY
jgi:hypothetical protein